MLSTDKTILLNETRTIKSRNNLFHTGIFYLEGLFYFSKVKIGQKIKKLRELKNYTQEYMASRLGLSQSAYSKLEKDETEVSFSRIEEIAQILELSPEDIRMFNESMVFNLVNNKKANGLILNSVSANERKVYENYIESLKSEILNLREIINKVTGNKPSKK